MKKATLVISLVIVACTLFGCMGDSSSMQSTESSVSSSASEQESHSEPSRAEPSSESSIDEMDEIERIEREFYELKTEMESMLTYDYYPFLDEMGWNRYTWEEFYEMISDERMALAKEYTMPELSQIHTVALCAADSIISLVANDGSLFLWGVNYFGVLGDGTNITRHLPYKSEINNIEKIAISQDVIMVLTDTGELYASGGNGSGQMGLGEENRMNSYYRLTRVPFDKPVKDIAITGFHSMILTEDGEVYRAGIQKEHNKDYYDSGFDKYNPKYPIDCTFVKMDLPEKMASISTYSSNYVMIGESGKVYILGLLGGWYNCRRYETITEIVFPEPVVSVHATETCVLALSENNVLYGFGSNEFGHLLIDDTSVFAEQPIEIMRNVKQVSGSSGICAITESGECIVWGLSTYGSLGIGEEYYNEETMQDIVLKPHKLSIPEPVEQCSQSWYTGAAVAKSGKVYLWGLDVFNFRLDPEFKHENIKDIPFVDRYNSDWIIFTPVVMGE